VNGETVLFVDGSCSRLVLPAVLIHRGKVFALAQTMRGGLRLEAATELEVSRAVALEIGPGNGLNLPT
jgi:hypothetical protein